MPSVNITTSALRSVAFSLSQHSAEMRNIASTMENRVRSMQSWSDPRAQQFSGQISMVGKGIKLHVDNFAKMAEFLQKFAQQQEEAERKARQNIANI